MIGEKGTCKQDMETNTEEANETRYEEKGGKSGTMTRTKMKGHNISFGPSGLSIRTHATEYAALYSSYS
jgi:hypothetical protein